MSHLALERVTKRFAAQAVVDGVSLAAEEGEFVVFVGPSGCGKSTLLRMIAGLEEVSDGRIHLAGRDVTEVAPAARGVAMVFQSYALFPHMTVEENVGFGLRMAGMPRQERRARVAEAARILRIEDLLGRKPRQLSGGQRQRVAIGRAIVKKPVLFLFDEPLSNLDAELRAQMRVELARLHRDLGATMIYVTHDQVEAMTLADRIVVLRAGKVEQVGPPAELYERPANLFVAQFIGSPRMNLLRATVAEAAGGAVTVRHPALEGGSLALPQSANGLAPGASVGLGIRPEHLTLDGPGTGALLLQAELAENLGAVSQLYAIAPSGETLTALAPGGIRLAKGAPLRLALDPARCHLFDEAGRRIGAAPAAS